MNEKMGGAGIISKPMSREEAIAILALNVEEGKESDPLDHEDIMAVSISC